MHCLVQCFASYEAAKTSTTLFGKTDAGSAWQMSGWPSSHGDGEKTTWLEALSQGPFPPLKPPLSQLCPLRRSWSLLTWDRVLRVRSCGSRPMIRAERRVSRGAFLCASQKAWPAKVQSPLESCDRLPLSKGDQRRPERLGRVPEQGR